MCKLSRRTYSLPRCVVPAHRRVDVFTGVPAADGFFRPTWFSIEGEVAQHFVVEDVKVGKNSQLISPACFPASLFAGKEEIWRMDRLSSGMRLVLSVTNISDAPREFFGEVVGVGQDCGLDGLYVLGLGRYLVEPKEGTLVLDVQPQVPMVPSRLYVPQSVLEDVVVESAGVRAYDYGYKVEGEAACAVECSPNSVLSPDMLGLKNLGGDGVVQFKPNNALDAGDHVVLRVVNKAGAPRWFGGALLGWSARASADGVSY